MQVCINLDPLDLLSISMWYEEQIRKAFPEEIRVIVA
jgi:hypothetical protein